MSKKAEYAKRWEQRRIRESEMKELGMTQREWIIYKAQEWNKKYGTLTAMDWNIRLARNNYAKGRIHKATIDRIEAAHEGTLWPATSTVTKEFGKWNAMIEEAGMKPVRANSGVHPDRKEEHARHLKDKSHPRKPKRKERDD